MTLTLGTVIAREDGLLQRSVSQDAAGADDILIADPGATANPKLVSICGTVTEDSTIMFESGSTALTGAMDVSANQGIAWRGDADNPFLEGLKDEALTITVTGGAFRGVILYKVG
jgi:hypothetical protein